MRRSKSSFVPFSVRRKKVSSANFFRKRKFKSQRRRYGISLKTKAARRDFLSQCQNSIESCFK